MKYIVKNCTSLDSDGTTCQDCSYEDCGADDCINRTDCIIKQVIKVCKPEAVINHPKREKEYITVNGYQAILNMFDIEEVKE